ncbi:MAG TPA: FAD:protein FMN transferase [Noviherbaspirillum sp.]
MKRRAQPWLGTFVEIAIADALGDDILISCFNCAFSAIAEVHRLMSFHDAASDVSRINRASAGETVEVHPHTYEVLQAALSVTRESGGIFDVVCAVRLVEWGCLPSPEGSMPNYSLRHNALTLEDECMVRKSRALWIDLGGIAKGYAVDLAVAELKRCGVQSACVNAGGDLRVFGDTSFPVLIRDPRSPCEAGLQLQLQNEALASSGNYFSIGRYGSALVNGHDGQPCTGEFSVSVCASTCMLADALTKVVAASRDPQHPALAHFGAAAFII